MVSRPFVRAHRGRCSPRKMWLLRTRSRVPVTSVKRCQAANQKWHHIPRHLPFIPFSVTPFGAPPIAICWRRCFQHGRGCVALFGSSAPFFVPSLSSKRVSAARRLVRASAWMRQHRHQWHATAAPLLPSSHALINPFIAFLSGCVQIRLGNQQRIPLWHHAVARCSGFPYPSSLIACQCGNGGRLERDEGRLWHFCTAFIAIQAN